jgi:signal transduction histidine kinase
MAGVRGYSQPVSDDSGAGLRFPDGPKLELDQLIDQLVERAQDVKRAQGRLRKLVAAIDVITGELGIEAVLQHIVEAAVTLVGARYGALGVIGNDGGLERFIHVGIDPVKVDEIGPLPAGKGLLGALISDPNPIRLPQLSADERSSGFPAHHPPMDSFLGAPIRVRGEVFGNIYLTESDRGEFTAEDEELVRALAVTAGTAISNARLFDESRRQQRWLGASAKISARLMADSGEEPLRMIARRAHEVAEADRVVVMLRVPETDDVIVEAAVGDDADDLVGHRFSMSNTISGEAITTGEPILLRSGADASAGVTHLAVVSDGPIMVVPLVGTGRPIGALSLTRGAGRLAFTAADLAMTTAFANHASVAVELSAARADQQRVALLEDRDRIARDLHDHVIQQLFSTGLSLESVAARLGSSEPAAEKIRALVGDLDGTIRQIRTSIFELRGPLGGGSNTGLRSGVLDLVAELAAGLGFTPSVTFTGPVDSEIAPELADDVVACIREALTNIVKYAKAHAVIVEVGVDGGYLTVRVCDDGIGVGDTSRRSGLANLLSRAERWDGSCDVTARPTGGTELSWKAPVS